METAAIYAAHLALLIAGIVRLGNRPVLMILAGAMAASWIAGFTLGGPSRVAAFILIDFTVLIANEVFRDCKRDRSVGLVSLLSMIWATLYAIGSYTEYRTLATGLNAAVVVQLLIGGGMADELAGRCDDWLDRHWPWGARAMRYVVA